MGEREGAGHSILFCTCERLDSVCLCTRAPRVYACVCECVCHARVRACEVHYLYVCMYVCMSRPCVCGGGGRGRGGVGGRAILVVILSVFMSVCLSDV